LTTSTDAVLKIDDDVMVLGRVAADVSKGAVLVVIRVEECGTETVEKQVDNK
jgi:hypothetical protein